MDLMWTCLDRANFLFGFQRGKVEMKGTGSSLLFLDCFAGYSSLACLVITTTSSDDS